MTQQGGQFRAIDRLGHDFGCAERKTNARSGATVTMITGMLQSSGSAFSAGQHCPTVGLGHQNVERDRVRPQLAGELQRFVAAACLDGAVALAPQIGAQQIP